MAKTSVGAGSPGLARLRRRLEGQVLLPDEPGYHQARQVWNAMVDRRPAVIARCASPADAERVLELSYLELQRLEDEQQRRRRRRSWAAAVGQPAKLRRRGRRGGRRLPPQPQHPPLERMK